MIRSCLAAISFTLAISTSNVAAEPDHHALGVRTLEEVIQPASIAFATATAALREAADNRCAAMNVDELHTRSHAAWDRWMSLQQFRFGPLEEEDRALQISFWPDKRGRVGRMVAQMLAAQDPAIEGPDGLARLSIAARGFPALERLLYDDTGRIALDDAFRCRYIAAVARDLDRLAIEIEAAWNGDWAMQIRTAGAAENTTFLAPEEVSQRLFATLLGALEETATGRLARPLGTLGNSRPRLAEAWRSGRSLRHIEQVVDTAEQTTRVAFAPDLTEEDQTRIAEAVATVKTALIRVREVGTLPEAIVSHPLRVEVLQQSVEHLTDTLRETIGPGLGIAQGFNSVDGD